MRMALAENLDSFNYKKTKKNVNNYFEDLEKLEWEQARLNAQKGLIAKYEVAAENEKQQYIPIGKDEFNLAAKAEKTEEIQKHLAGYHWAKSILTEQEQLYITEYFINGKYEDEVVAILGFHDIHSKAYKKLKRRAIYKFAYVLNLIV